MAGKRFERALALMLCLLLAGCSDAPEEEGSGGSDEPDESDDDSNSESTVLAEELKPGFVSSTPVNPTGPDGQADYHAVHWAQDLTGAIGLNVDIKAKSNTKCTLAVAAAGAPGDTGFVAFSMAGYDGSWYDWQEHQVMSENTVSDGSSEVDPEPADDSPVAHFWRTSHAAVQEVSRVVLIPDAQSSGESEYAGTFAVDAYCHVPFKMQLRTTQQFGLANEATGAAGIRSVGPTVQTHPDGGMTVSIAGENGTAFAFHGGSASVGELEIRTPGHGGGIEMFGNEEQRLILRAGAGDYVISHDYTSARSGTVVFANEYLVYGAFGNGQPLESAADGLMDSAAITREDAGPELE